MTRPAPTLPFLPALIALAFVISSCTAGPRPGVCQPGVGGVPALPTGAFLLPSGSIEAGYAEWSHLAPDCDLVAVVPGPFVMHNAGIPWVAHVPALNPRPSREARYRVEIVPDAGGGTTVMETGSIVTDSDERYPYGEIDPASLPGPGIYEIHLLYQGRLVAGGSFTLTPADVPSPSQ